MYQIPDAPWIRNPEKYAEEYYGICGQDEGNEHEEEDSDHEGSVVHVFDIIWDTEQEDGSIPSAEDCGLPTEIDIPMSELIDMKSFDEDFEAALDSVADWLSDNYDFCVIGFSALCQPSYEEGENI